MRLVGLQVLLMVIGIAAGVTATVLGLMFEHKLGSPAHHWDDGEMTYGSVSVAASSGFDGGALGLSIVCIGCLALVTWIQITQLKLTKEA